MKDTLEILMLEDKEFLAKLCMYYSRQAENFERALDEACEELSGKWSVNWEDERNTFSPEEWKEWLIKHSSL